MASKIQDKEQVATGEPVQQPKPPPNALEDGIRVSRVIQEPHRGRPSKEQWLWSAIRNRTLAVGFEAYKRFIDQIMCGADKDNQLRKGEARSLHAKDQASRFRGNDAYDLLKESTELFLMQECGVSVENDVPGFDLAEEANRLGRTAVTFAELGTMRQRYLVELSENRFVLPYLNVVREALNDLPLKGPNEVPPNCYGILGDSLERPCLLELIWSYWHEEGMLVQTMNAVALRFQNRRNKAAGRDPMARFELSPLRPLTNLIWGYLQDETHRLSVQRRALEYNHQYGLTLVGRAVGDLDAADSRTAFLEAFHHLLHEALAYYRQADNTFVVADAFPVLNALKELALILQEGMHNQYRDLPWTARAEMLMQQWMLARPELRDFLGGRTMVTHAEPWMDRVDAMKSLQGWSDVSIAHYHDLAIFGERLLLSVRFGNWAAVQGRDAAANWAAYWRDDVQGYVHAYRAVTGVDLAATVTTRAVDRTAPSVLLKKRLERTPA